MEHPGYIEGSIVRTARKEHRCGECHKPIQRGERYVEYVGEVAAYQSGSRYHIGACADRQVGEKVLHPGCAGGEHQLCAWPTNCPCQCHRS